MIDQRRVKFLKKEEEVLPDELTVTMFGDQDPIHRSENLKRLYRYMRMWDAMSSFRRRRERCKEYRNGNQWNDIVEVHGKRMTEAQNIVRQGNVPLKNNVISHLLTSVLGVMRQAYAKPEAIARVRDNQTIGEMVTNMLEYIYQHNEMKELDLKDFEEFLIGGLAVQMVDYWWDDKTGQNEINVTSWNPSRLFLPSDIQDPRGRDINCIGVIMDLPKEQVITKFARNLEDEERIKQIYAHVSRDYVQNLYATFTRSQVSNLDFFTTKDNSTCRVIQAWELESRRCLLVHDRLEGRQEIYPLEEEKDVDAMIEERKIDAQLNGIEWDRVKITKKYHREQYWYVRYLSPYGDVLYEAKTPFSHKDHPFSLCFGSLIDGEVHSFVENIIDQQRYINRNITLMDFIIRSSAKGVLVFPENAIPKGMKKDDILEEWQSFNGVIFANMKAGMPMPTQIANNCTNIGLNEVIAMEMNLVRDISGVHGAMQGKEAKSGVAASLYAQEAENSKTNILNVLEEFGAFRVRRDYKCAKLAPQCYDEEFYMAVAGKDLRRESQMWRPEMARKADVYVSISESNNSPIYRAAINEILIKAMEMNLADLKTVLKAGTIAGSDRLVRMLEEEEEKLKQEQAAQQAAMLQGQAQGAQMQEQGASNGQIMQAAANAAAQGLEQQQSGTQGTDPMAMQLLQQALSVS